MAGGMVFLTCAPWRPLGRWTLGREKMQAGFYDFVVIESMMDIRNMQRPGSGRYPCASPPEKRSLAPGASSSNWDSIRRAGTQTVHLTVPAAMARSWTRAPCATANPENYRQLIDYIIDDLGWAGGATRPSGKWWPFSRHVPGPCSISAGSRMGSCCRPISVCHSRFPGRRGPPVRSRSDSPSRCHWASWIATDGYGGWGRHGAGDPHARSDDNRSVVS